jgi:hypothetical protein
MKRETMNSKTSALYKIRPGPHRQIEANLIRVKGPEFLPVILLFTPLAYQEPDNLVSTLLVSNLDELGAVAPPAVDSGDPAEAYPFEKKKVFLERAPSTKWAARMKAFRDPS